MKFTAEGERACYGLFHIFREVYHMKIRARKLAALLMAVTLMSATGTSAVSPVFGEEAEVLASAEETPDETLEEEPEEEPAEEEETPPAEEEEPAEPETIAPATEAPAPATEAPAPATEAPQQTESAAPATEAPQQPESTAASTEASSEKATEKSAEKEKKADEDDEDDDETEEEGKSRTFETKVTKGTISVKLPKGKGIVESGSLVCDFEKYDNEEDNRAKVDKAILGKQRVITGGRFYSIWLDDGEDLLPLPEGTKVTFTRSEGMDLGLKPQLQCKTHIYNVGTDSAQEIGADISLDQNLGVTGFSFTAPGKLEEFALIAEENRANNGAAVSRGSVVSSIGEAGNFAAVAESVSGKVQGESISNSTDLLDQLAGYSVSLANAQSGSDAAVVNVYTDSEGNVLTNADDEQDPMRAVLSGGQIDISGGRMVVVNYVVTNPDAGHVSLPHYDVVSDGQTVDKKSVPELAGRFVVTVTAIAQGTDGDYQLKPYTGGVDVSKQAVGTYLVPNGSITTGGRLVGAAYARSVSVASGRKIIKATVKAEYGSDEEKSEEKEPSSETETETEAESDEPVLKAAEEAEQETNLAETEAETETETEEAAVPMQASADGESPYKGGGLDAKSVEVYKVDDTDAPVTGVTLKLYSGDAPIIYMVDGQQKEIPANTELDSHAFAAGDPGWDISDFIKTTGETGPLTSSYVIKETTMDQTATQTYTKAWDFRFTYNDGTKKIEKDGTDVDPSTIDGMTPAPETPSTIKIVDSTRTSAQSAVIEVVDADNASTKLADVPFSIWKVAENGTDLPVDQQEKEVEFTSATTASTIDLAGLVKLVKESLETTTSMTFAIREEKPAPTYEFADNKIAGVTPTPFTSEVKITITKNGTEEPTIAGLPTSTTDNTIRFKQKKVKFQIEAHYDTASGAFVPNVGFKMTLDGADYTNYTTDPAGAAATTDNKITVTLTKPEELVDKTLILSWTSIPAGYVYKSGAYPNVEVYKSGTPNDAIVILDTKTIKVAASTVRKGNTFYIAETAFEVAAGSRFYYTGKTAADKFVEIKLTKEQADAVSQNGGLTVNGTQAPFGYTISGNTVVSGDEYTIPLKEKSKAGSVVVTKETRENSIDGDPYYVPETKEGSKKRRIPKAYYVTAFTDAALTKPAYNVKYDEDGKVISRTIISKQVDVPYAWYYSNIKSNTGNKTAVLEGLYLDETYYLAETTDAKKGIVLQPDKDKNGIKAIWFKTKGASDSRSKIAVKLTSKTAKSVDMVNVYAEKGLSRATYRIKVNVVDSNNKAKSSVLTASFRIWGEDNTHWGADIPVKLVDTASSTKEDNSYRWNAGDYNPFRIWGEMVSLKDASGNDVWAKYDLVDPKNNYKVLASGSTFKNKISAIQTYTKNKKHIYIELKPGEKNKHTLEYTLRERKSEKETAELKLTKAVTYKKTPIRVNGTYYIGIFEDAAHKKLLFKKAMSLANASSMTSTLKINLYKLAAPHTITLYFAETDKNGKVVSSGKKSGYDISLNKESVTLSPTNADESIVLTNNVRDGSVAAANLTNPSSGFAGDASALAEAQALSNGEATASKPTGDDTPYEPFALTAGISAAIIFLLLALLMAKKKLLPGQKTKQ